MERAIVTLGILLLISLGGLIASGVYLKWFYRPTESHAWGDIRTGLVAQYWTRKRRSIALAFRIRRSTKYPRESSTSTCHRALMRSSRRVGAEWTASPRLSVRSTIPGWHVSSGRRTAARRRCCLAFTSSSVKSGGTTSTQSAILRGWRLGEFLAQRPGRGARRGSLLSGGVARDEAVFVDIDAMPSEASAVIADRP